MKREIHPAVYIMASARNGTLYIGVTFNLIQRIWQHREGVVEGFTSKYRIKTLVWYEQHDTMESAITREKSLKKWNRDWKLRLIETSNPDWHDLWSEITGDESTPEPPTARHSRAGGNPEHGAAPSSPCHSRAGGNPEQGAAPSSPRHSRAGGNPEQDQNTVPKALDSRLRGNDGEAS